MKKYMLLTEVITSVAQMLPNFEFHLQKNSTMKCKRSETPNHTKIVIWLKNVVTTGLANNIL